MFRYPVYDDLKRGIIKRIRIYILFAAAAVILCVISYLKLIKWQKCGRIDGEISILDLYMVFYRGSNIINPDEVKNFYMTEEYMLMSVGFAFIIGNYAAADLYGYGLQLIIRCRSTGRYWAGKIVWVLASNTVIHSVIFFSMLLITVSNQYSCSLSVNKTVLDCLGYQQNLEYNGRLQLLLMVITPFISTFSLCILQMLLSMVFSSIVALVFIMAEMSAAVYSNKAVFFSNGLMFKRNGIFYMNGTNSIGMLMIPLAADIAVILTGYIFLSRRDFLKKGE
jgi:hypothetical protein